MTVYDYTGTPVSTPSYDPDEGYPIYDGVTATPVYVGTGIRSQRQIIGVRYTGDIDDIEADRWNEYLRAIYQQYKILNRLDWLVRGYEGHDEDGAAYTNVNINDGLVFHYIEYPATGSGSVYTINFMEDSSSDPRNFMSQGRTIQPCFMASPTTYKQMAWVQDLEFLTTTTARVTLDKSIDITSDNTLVIGAEWVMRPYPILHIREAPGDQITNGTARCLHDIPIKHSILSSYKTVYSSGAWVDGVRSGTPDHYCDKFKEATVDLSQFQTSTGCRNTSCQFYEAHHGLTPDSTYTSFPLLGRGLYYLQTTAGVAGVKVGNENFDGLLAMMGYPVGYYTNGLLLPTKTFLGLDRLRHRQIDTDGDGHDEFLTFIDLQNQYYDAGLTPTDDAGILSTIAFTDGRETSGLGEADPEFELQIGERRTQGIAPAYTSSPDGGGEMGGTRRIMPRRYTSAKFTVGTLGTYANQNGETSVSHTTPTSVLSFRTYNVTWDVPRFGEIVGGGGTGLARGYVNAKVRSGTHVSTNIFKLEFQPGQVSLYSNGGVVGEANTVLADVAGNVVRLPNALEIYNPAGPRSIGDRREGLCPGDTVDFGAGYKFQCVATSPMSGSTETLMRGIPSGLTGVPDYTRANQHKRDVAWFTYNGSRGGRLKVLGASSLLNQSPVIAGDAVSPPLYNMSGATAYAPTLKWVSSGGTETTLTDYDYDPALGRFYIDLTAAGITGTGNLYADMVVYDTRKTYNIESANRNIEMIEHVIDNGWVQLENVDSSTIAMFSADDPDGDGPNIISMSESTAPSGLAFDDLQIDQNAPPGNISWGYVANEESVRVGFTQLGSMSGGTVSVSFEYKSRASFLERAVRRFKTGEIANVICQWSFETPVINRFGVNIVDGVPTTIPLLGDTANDLDGVRLVLVKITDDGAGDLTFTESGISVSLSEGTANGDAMQGQVSVTSIVNHIIDNPLPELQRWALIVAGRRVSSIPTIGDWRDVAKEFCPVFSCPVPGTPLNETHYWELFTCASYTLVFYANMDSAEVADTVDMHTSSDGHVALTWLTDPA